MELHVIVLDSSDRAVGNAEVNLTYSCDYITEQGALLVESQPNGTASVVLDCGYLAPPYLLTLHVTVSAFGYDDYSFSDTREFFAQANDVTYRVRLTASYRFVHSYISLENFSLCSENAPNGVKPMLLGIIHVNGNLPIDNFHVFVNGTDEGLVAPPIILTTTVPSGGPLSYEVLFGTELGNQTLHIMADEAYEVTIIANFQDGTASAASTTIIAKPGACTSS
jgi:hypothetical protein